MTGVVLRIVARSMFSLWLLAMVSWTAVECSSQSPARRAAEVSGRLQAGDVTMPLHIQEKIVSQVAQEKGFHGPFIKRMLKRTVRVLLFDFGHSWKYGFSVSSLLFGKEGLLSLGLCLCSVFLALCFALCFALHCAQQPGGWTDSILMILSALTLSLSLAWVCMIRVHA